jgi:hypothetical protein
MNRIPLEGEALSRCAKSMSAMIDEKASFENIFDCPQQVQDEEQAGRVRTCRAARRLG